MLGTLLRMIADALPAQRASLSVYPRLFSAFLRLDKAVSRM